jgi:thermitase
MVRMSIAGVFRSVIAGWLALAVALSALTQPAQVHASGNEGFVPGQVVVRLLDGADLNLIHLAFRTTTLDQLFGSTDTFLLGIPAGSDPRQLAEQIGLSPLVVYAEPNFLTDMPEDSSTDRIYGWAGEDPVVYEDQTAVRRMNLSTAHDYSAGAGTVVAILDTGAQLDHPLLSESLHPLGFDFVDRDPIPAEERNGLDMDGDGRVDEGYGHGTHVAGIVHLGAPEAELMILRVLDSDGRGNTFWTASAIRFAMHGGANVINLSLGTAAPAVVLSDAVQAAAQQGVVIAAAAGNVATRAPQYPAADLCAIGVAAVTYQGIKSDFSSYGAWVGISAPGEDIFSAFPENGYASWSGTSMAAPLAAAQASLLLSVEPEASLDRIGQLMGATSLLLDARNPAYRGDLGYGLMNITASLEAQAAGVELSAERDVLAGCTP